MTLKSSKPFTVKKRQKLNERIMNAYDRGFKDGYDCRDMEWFDYEQDMEIMREERKEIGVV